MFTELALDQARAIKVWTQLRGEARAEFPVEATVLTGIATFVLAVFSALQLFNGLDKTK
jgi:hypothetical protein